MTEQSGPFIQSSTEPGVLNLGLGQPSPSLLPIGAVRDAASAALAGIDPLVLQYGAKRGPAGFLDSLAEFLSREYGHRVAAEQLLVTGGISQGLSLVSDVLGRRHGRVVAEDPTYFLARGILETAGLEVVGVPVDEHGLDVQALSQRLDAGLSVDFVYCIPAYHNPSSVCLSPDRARALVELAEQHDFIVIADEPYALLNFGPRPACLMSVDQGRGRVLSLGSFSKILGPGLRLGWAHAAPALIDRLAEHGVLRSGGGLNPVVSVIVQRLVDDGFLDEHVVSLRKTLNARAQALCEALEQHVPEVRFLHPDGGYFVWLKFPPGVDTSALDERARSGHGVGFTPGTRCAVARDLSDCARLSFAFYDEGELAEAVRRLRDAI